MRRSLLWLFVTVTLALSISAAAQSKLKTVNVGREGLPFEISDTLVRGQITVVEFASRSCSSCRNLEEKLSQLQSAEPKLAIRRVEIDRAGSQGVDWQSPLVRQYNLSSVPHFKIYDAAGKLIAEGEPARKQVIRFMREAQVL